MFWHDKYQAPFLNAHLYKAETLQNQSSAQKDRTEHRSDNKYKYSTDYFLISRALQP
jgi:hypothetical protein